MAAISALTPLKLLPIDFTSTLPEEFFEYVTKPLDGVGGPINSSGNFRRTDKFSYSSGIHSCFQIKAKIPVVFRCCIPLK